MIIIAGELRVVPSERDRYLDAVAAVTRQARSAGGCHDFVQAPDPLDPERIIIFERWESDDDLHRFRETPGPALELPAVVSADVRKYRISGIEAVTDYDDMYRDGTAPWEIGVAQPALDLDVTGPRVLDIGCGSGEVALELARRGHRVTGVDISAVAVGQARAKAAAEGLSVDFRVGDARALVADPFDAVVDSGLLHSLHRYGGVDDYLDLLPRLVVPGGSLTILAISADGGHHWGVTEDYLLTSFAPPAWTGTTVAPVDVIATTGTLPGFLLRTHAA